MAEKIEGEYSKLGLKINYVKTEYLIKPFRKSGNKCNEN